MDHTDTATSSDDAATPEVRDHDHASHGGDRARDAAHGAPRSGRGLLLLEIGAVLLALVLLFAWPNHDEIGTLAVVFVSVVLEALPFVLLGAVVGGFIEVYLPRDKLGALLPARATYTVLLAALLGLIFPVCECAVVPVVRRLVSKGVPLAAAVAYLLAGPIVNPIVATSTAVAYGFDWSIVLIRLVAGFGIAVAAGTLMGELFTARQALLSTGDDDSSDSACGCTDCASPRPRGWARAHQALTCAAEDFLDMGRFLVLGAFFAALMQTYVDRRAFLLLMTSPALSIGLMMVLALALNLCSEADAFVAASFRGSLPLSAQMAFMVLGPMLDVKLLLMYLGLFRRRAIFALATTTLVFVFVTMLAMQWLAGRSQ
jgi:uncharacterized membrane protein YraQ (UPF0718 family)